jgi:hypothetical protein
LREDRDKVIRLAVLGFISVASAGLLLMLHYQALTGSFFMSPYALERGSGSLRDITLDPRLVLEHLPVLTRWSVQGTTLYAFPFLWIMSVYALVADRRRELYFLAALFMSLVVGHLLVVAPTGTRFGERIWFEAYFGAAILGARGWLLFAERRQLPRHATHVVLAAAFAVQGLYYIKLAGEARARFEPHYRVQQAIQELAVSDAVIFLKNAPGFRARDLNLNQADWKASSQFYMPDPGTERRALVAKALGKRRWLVIAYDSGTRRARVEEVVDSP